MKIIHLVSTTSAKGGLENVTLHLAQQQVKIGHQVWIIGSAEFSQKVKGTGINLVPVNFSGSRKNPILLFNIWKIVKGISPHILHLQANKSANIGKTLKPFLGKTKTVATIHNTKKTIKCFSGHDAVTAVSKKAGTTLGNIPHKVIWNGVPKPTSHMEISDLPAKHEFTICSFGRFVPAKGYDLLLEALSKTQGINLWLIGDGELRQDLSEQCKALNIEDRVWMPGYRADAMQIATHSDLFIMSSHKEGFPLTVIEMLHLKQPIISTAVAGVEEILPENCLIKPTTAEAIKEKLIWVKENPINNDMKTVYEVAEKELTVTRMAEKIDALYNDVIGA